MLHEWGFIWHECLSHTKQKKFKKGFSDVHDAHRGYLEIKNNHYKVAIMGRKYSQLLGTRL